MFLTSVVGKEINIPFRDDMAEAVVKRNKECTSRSRKKGEPGDYFFVEHKGVRKKCILYDVVRIHLLTVGEFLYRQEGFESPDQFEGVWCSLHPRVRYLDNPYVYVHFFMVVDCD